MATIESLKTILRQPEGIFLERKLQSVDPRDIRRTLVAFANTVSGSEEAILFIGVRDEGSIEGCSNPDTVQKSVRDICQDQCFPPLAHQIYILPEQRNVVAVVVTPSSNGPHFSGAAYVRKGAASVAASPEVFSELIYSRNAKAAILIKIKNSFETVRVTGTRFGRVERRALQVGVLPGIDCQISACNAHYVTFETLATREKITEPLEHIAISRDDHVWKTRIIVSQQ